MMPVKNVSHDESGAMITRVPVKYKVAIGLPKGYRGSDGSLLGAPKKLFHFIVQSRDENGDWAVDHELSKELFGSEKQPKDVKIQLIGDSIDDMIRGDLFYWDNRIGAKCSCGTLKSYFQKWCFDNDITWEQPLSKVQSESELRLLLDEKRVSKRVAEFLSKSETIIKAYNEKMVNYGSYEIGVSDFISASLAKRRIHNSYVPFPCLFRNCPDFAYGRCKYNGRFFFIFDGHDIGDIATFVTTSSRNIRNIQWGLENIVQKVIASHPKEKLTMHGISCRLSGTVERGMYTNDTGGQSSTKFFVVRLRGPHDNMIQSVKAILNRARLIKKLYPDGISIKFDEGDERLLANERINEFSNDDTVKTIQKETSGKGFKVRNEFLESRFDPDRKQLEYQATLLSLPGVRNSSDKTMMKMIEAVGGALNKTPESNGKNIFFAGLKKAIEDRTLTIDKLLKSQGYLDKIHCEIDLGKTLTGIRKKQKNRTKNKTKKGAEK